MGKETDELIRNFRDSLCDLWSASKRQSSPFLPPLFTFQNDCSVMERVCHKKKAVFYK